MRAINVLLGLILSAIGAAHAAPVDGSAFADSLQGGKTICLSKADLATLKTKEWLAAIQKRGKSCHITLSESPLPTYWTWQADCTDNRGATYHHRHSVTLPGITGNKLIIDARISDAAGNLKSKKAFFGEAQGACADDNARFAYWDYFDLPDRRALESVARDLLYCGTLYSGLALRVPAAKRDAVAGIGKSFIASAATVLPDDQEFLNRELAPISDRVAEELVGANGEKLGQLAQSGHCAAYLKDDGIADAIRNYDAAAGQ